MTATGIGWDASSVYIGIPTEEDVHQYAGSLGISFDPGSLQADAKAFVTDLNARGGLFGRHVVAVFHDNATADLEANPGAAAEANCTAFTQDHRVIAVINAVPLIDTPNFHACLQQSHTPLLTSTSVLYDNTSFRQYGPYLWHTLEPSMSVFGSAWMGHLQRLRYFSGWNTATGSPGPAAVRVGILMPNDEVSQRVAAAMKVRLGQLGIAVASEYAYHDSAGSYGAEMSSAVLQFSASHVTHVLNIPPIALALITFMQTAEQQRFRPRYAMNSVINPFAITPNVPKAQLSGSVGIGWLPDTDVDTAHDPGTTAPQHECLGALARSGEHLSGDGKRSALFAAYVLCTSLNLVIRAAAEAGGLTPQVLAQGIAFVGPGFPTAATFHSGLSANNPAMPDVVRDLFFTPSCTCFTYRGSAHPM